MITLNDSTLKYCTLGDKKCRLITLGNNVVHFDGSYYPDDTNYGIFNKDIENVGLKYTKQDNYNSGREKTTDCSIDGNLLGLSCKIKTDRDASLSVGTTNIICMIYNKDLTESVFQLQCYLWEGIDFSFQLDQKYGNDRVCFWHDDRDVNYGPVRDYYIFNMYNYGNSIRMEMHDNLKNVIKVYDSDDDDYKNGKQFWEISGMTLGDLKQSKNLGNKFSNVCVVQTSSSTY